MSRDALVVGINTYGKLQSLSAPAEDAEAVAQLLTNYGNFRVRRLPEAVTDNTVHIGLKTKVTLTELEEALVQLFMPEGDNIPETALLFFSGHGLRKSRGIPEGFLATSDADLVGNWGVRLKWLREILEKSPIQRHIIWLDCCYSGELLNFAESLKEADPGNLKGRDRCFITACREFEVAYEEKQRGVLTTALLQGLDPTQRSYGYTTNHTLADFINQELQTATQRPLCYNSGSAILLTATRAQKPVDATGKDICPYKGLEFFKEEDAEFFYGRSLLTDELIEKVRTGNFIAVLGASGSGKSSVVRAGLLYQLRLGQRLPGSDKWQFYQPFTPGEHPLQSLKDAVGKEGDELEQFVATAEAERVVLVVDQFEECFTLCQGSPEKERERQLFFDCLLNTLARTDNKLCLVLAMRTDFLDKCAAYPNLANKIREEKSLKIVTSMNREELEAAIIKPAEKVGLEVEPLLVTRLIEDVADTPGILLLLESALAEVWQARKQPLMNSLTLLSYNELGGEWGGIKRILEKRVNEVYQSLSPEEQLVAKRIFLELIDVGEETELKFTSKSVHKERLVELVTCQESPGVVQGAIAKLEQARLMIANDAGRFNIAHEALIRYWQKLSEWVKENPVAQRQRKKIQDLADEWEGKGKSRDYLLQKAGLNEAEVYCQSYADTLPLSKLAQELIQKSREERDRDRRHTIYKLK